MDSNTIFISLIYYIGIASCAAQGAEKGKYDNSIPILRYIANAFGGGFMRDVIFLGIPPWLLTLSALPDIMLVVIVGVLYTYYFCVCNICNKYYDIAMLIIAISDAFGLGSFVCIGMDKAFLYSDNIFIIIACGYITAIGGGILASGKSITEIAKSKEMIRYHLVTLLGCCYYYIFRHSLCLVCFIAIGIILSNTNYKVLYDSYSANLMLPCYKVCSLYPIIYKNGNSFHRQKIIKIIKNYDICSRYSKIYLIQHRIRQC